MCLIIDTNLAADFFCSSSTTLAPLKKAVMSATCCVYYGGSKLRKEYFQSSKIQKMIVALDRAGRAKAIRDDLVDARIGQIENLCISNDSHIIALALESGARLLCSHDADLHTDFTNTMLINKPRGHVYQNSSHKHLIRKHHKSC